MSFTTNGRMAVPVVDIGLGGEITVSGEELKVKPASKREQKQSSL